MSAESLVSQVINDARTIQTETKTAAIGYTDAAQTAALNVLTLAPLPTIDDPDIDLPPFEPDTDLGAEFQKEFDKALAEYGPDFKTELANYVDTYFPELDGCLKTSIDGWICDIINGVKTLTLPPGVEEALWQRGRDRVETQRTTEREQVLSQFSSRGFTMPSGFLAGELARVDRVAHEKISDINRELTIKQAELLVENVRFAVEQGNRLRIAALGALDSFIRSWIAMNELPIKRAAALVDAKTKLFSVTAAYYNAIVAVAQVKLAADELKVNSQLKENDQVVQMAISSLDARVKAAVEAADTMATIAAAASSAQNTMASISNSTNKQE